MIASEKTAVAEKAIARAKIVFETLLFIYLCSYLPLPLGEGLRRGPEVMPQLQSPSPEPSVSIKLARNAFAPSPLAALPVVEGNHRLKSVPLTPYRRYRSSVDAAS